MNRERLLELQGDLFADDCDISDPTILDWSEPDVIAYLESGGAIKPAAAPPPAPPPAPHPAPPPADSRKLEPPPAATFTPHPQFKLTREHAQRLITLKRNADGKYFLGTQLKNGDYLRDGTILTDDDESGLDAGDKVLELGDSYQSLSTSCHHLPDIFSELDQNESTYTVMVERQPPPLPALLSLHDLLERIGCMHLLETLLASEGGGVTLGELKFKMESLSRANMLSLRLSCRTLGSILAAVRRRRH